MNLRYTNASGLQRSQQIEMVFGRQRVHPSNNVLSQRRWSFLANRVRLESAL